LKDCHCNKLPTDQRRDAKFASTHLNKKAIKALNRNNLTKSFNPWNSKLVEVLARLGRLRVNKLCRTCQRRNLVPKASDNINRNIGRIAHRTAEIQTDFALKLDFKL
jgi:hypothetical protein